MFFHLEDGLLIKVAFGLKDFSIFDLSITDINDFLVLLVADSQEETRKPTIDKEFEEYFSALML